MWVVLGVLACVAGAVVVWKETVEARRQIAPPSCPADTETVSLDADAVARIEAFCGDCHAVPKPDSFPRYAWHNEVMLGYAIYAKSGRQDLKPPRMEETFAYYRQRAPEQLTFPEPPEAPQKLAVPFHVERLKIEETGGVKPAVAHLNWLRLQPEAEPELVVTDMRRGTVMALSPGKTGAKPRLLASLNQPCHVEACDLDGNGATDLVVADLGSMAAIDHHRGRVVWLRPQAADSSYEPIVVASDLGRVDDVRPGDFDNDGDIDLLVAVFGLDRTGDTRMLWNVARRGETPRFQPEIIDPRPGPIHVPPSDFDGDGYLDFASLISQEYEQVAVFINQRGSPQRDRVVPYAVAVGRARLDVRLQRHSARRPRWRRGRRRALHQRRCVRQQLRESPPWRAVVGESGPAEIRLPSSHGSGGACVASAGDLDLDGDLDIIGRLLAARQSRTSQRL